SGPSGKLYLCDQPWHEPANISLLGRSVGACERAFLGGRRLILRQQILDRLTPISGADTPDVLKMSAAIDPRKQRSHRTRFGGPAAEDDLVARPAFRLAPAVAAPAAVRRILALRHDAFEPQFASGLEHR